MSAAGSVGTGSTRRTLSGLTARGRCFLAAGIACVVVAVLLGQRDLLRVGILLAALPLVSAWVLTRSRYRLACVRHLGPARVPAGAPADVVVRLDNVSRLPTGLLLVEDQVPYALGPRPRFVLDRVEPRGHRAVSYQVCSEVRGRYALGPLSLRITDPFGLCELTRSFAQRDPLTVTPRVEPLPSISLGGEWSGSGESRSRSLAAAGEDDVATREYRHGDPLHRVHWRSTARLGELMVRREEQPWQSRATLLLDTRARAHRGEGPGSSFEWAVAAAASIGVHLVRHGYAVRLVTDTGAGVSSAAHDSDGVGGDFEGLLLDALSVARPSPGSSLREVGPVLRRSADGLLVVVLGRVDLDEVAELSRLHPAGASAVAVLLDTAAWGSDTGSQVPGRRQRDRVVARTSERTLERSAAFLTQAGWRVLTAGDGDSLGALWPRASRGAYASPSGTGVGTTGSTAVGTAVSAAAGTAAGGATGGAA